MDFLIGIFLGIFIEWNAHKYLLHNVPNRLFSKSHFSVHHKKCRKNNNFDDDYLNFPPTDLENGLAEIVLLISAVVATTPIMLFSFYLWLGLVFHAVVYYLLHRKSHIDVEWGKKWLPWHYDHHMGKNQNANWGVTTPIFDWVFGTRKKRT